VHRYLLLAGVSLFSAGLVLVLPAYVEMFVTQADICQLGMDQRKVNMLAREYCDECKPKKKFKPIILSHRMPGFILCSCSHVIPSA
jgi:tRNA synthetases class I (W and Y)